MNRFLKPLRPCSPKAAAASVVALTGFVAVALAGIALAKTFTLQVAKNAKVTNQTGTTKPENIAVSHGFAVYSLTGDSKRHPECIKANGCFSVWPPVTVGSHTRPSKAPGIRGKLGIWHRNGFNQLTLGGHPLYRYAPDSHRGVATGEGIHSFGGTWHVITAAGSSATGSTTPPSSTTTTTTMPSTPCYPPYC